MDRPGKDMAMAIAWPMCWAKAPEKIFERLKKLGLFKSTYFQIGHAAIVLVNGANGELEYFDFGRYTTGATRGRIRSFRSDPKLKIDIRARFDPNGDLENLEDILRHLKSMEEHMHGEGPMHVSVCDQFDFHQSKRAIESLQDTGSQEYGSVISGKTNCASFVQQALLWGAKCEKTKLRLRFPLTFLRSTPLGNVEAVETSHNYVVTADEVKTKKRIDQIGVVWKTFQATVINITQKTQAFPVANSLQPPPRNAAVPAHAQWVGGQGEGTWLSLMPVPDAERYYRIVGQSVNGEIEYDYIAVSDTDHIDWEKPYRFVVDCSRLRTSVMQNSRRIILKHSRDFTGIS